MEKEEGQFVMFAFNEALYIMSSCTYKLLFVMASTLILNIFNDNKCRYCCCVYNGFQRN